MPQDGFWTSKPPAGTPINRHHPLAEGLAAFWAFNESAGAANDAVGAVAGLRLNTSSSGAGWPVWTAHEGGALDFSGTQYIASSTGNMVSDGPFLGTITVVVRGLIRTGSAYREFVTKAAGSGVASNPFEFRTNNAASPALVMVRAATGNNYREYTGPAVTLNRWQTWGISINSGHVIATNTFYIDGVPTLGTNTGGGGNDVVAGTNEDVWIGRRKDGVVQMNGLMSFVAVWSRALSSDEHKLMASTPFAMFEPPAWRRIFVATAPAATSVANQAIWIG